MRIALLLTAAALLAGCAAPATRVTLLPLPEDKPSAVEVDSNQQSIRISRPYDSAQVYIHEAQSDIKVEQLDAGAVRQRYGQLLSVQPASPERFILNFQAGSSNLTPESQTKVADVLANATARPGGEIVVVGYTDRVGKPDSNDALSLRRAQAIREMLIQRGFKPNRVTAVGRGERDPIVPTAEQVDEPRNRRVEILVR